MEIISENGKDYLISYVAKIDNSTIDAGNLFVDMSETVYKILNNQNKKNKTRNTYIANGYGLPIQSFLNRYSGNYISPSFMKGYATNPALNLMQNFFVEQANDATAIGTSFHKVLEDYYNLPKEERNRDKLWGLEVNALQEGQSKELLDEYIKGYYDIKDYLHPRKELDDTKLECKTEHRGRSQIYIPKLNVTLPCKISYVADRIDFRDDEVIILDYKTGHPTEEAAGFDGYLGSMLLYKWAMEQELNVEITKGYLICPGNTASKKYIPLDYSTENEKIMVDKIMNFYKDFAKDNSTRLYKFTEEGYFTTDDSKSFRECMNDNTIWMSKIPVKFYIGETEESEL